ncbi:putative transposase, Ptta/En/Spm, plant [Sesbania bispinosa]|nr:putative transposase, Ptta/En/Spm, plant [Sesbania bispinosa]
MAEMMTKTGQPVSRGTLYIHTHKRNDGTYINEEAQEKISEIESQGTAPIAISPNDSLGQVFGKEHSGRVRGVSFGVCPSQKVEVLLTHILMNSSIPVPPDLAGSLDIQTPGAQPSSQLDINQLG